MLAAAATPSSPTKPGPAVRLALVVSERLVNLPVQLVPPMYDMLANELDAAVSEVRRSGPVSAWRPI